VAALGGLNALVFTGGTGENAAPIRVRIAAGLVWLGVEIDEAANAAVALPAHGMCGSKRRQARSRWLWSQPTRS
jgi:acetate kinase